MDGPGGTLPESYSSNCGVMSAAKFDECAKTVAAQVERVADLLLSLAEQDNSVVATDEWSIEGEWDELVALAISVLIGGTGLVLWYAFG